MFSPISVADRVQHFSGVSQKRFENAPQPQQFQQQQLQPQQQQFQPQQQQFQAQQQQFQAQPQTQQFSSQQQQFPTQQQQFQPQQQQFSPQQQQFETQQEQQFQPQTADALQQSLKQSLQQSLQKEIKNFQQSRPIQQFPTGAQVPQTNQFQQTPEHIKQFQQSQQSKQPLTVFGDPSQQAQSQFRRPSTAQFQQQANQFQQPTQNQPFTAFRGSQSSASNGQQPPARSFQTQGQQFTAELPRLSQQFQSRPQAGVFDQIKTAINTGRHFSPQQSQFPQRQQTAQQPRPQPTTQPPPKFTPLTAVPAGTEQIGTHRQLEETVRTQESVKKQKALNENIKENKKEQQVSSTTESAVRKTTEGEGEKKKQETKTKDQERLALVEELNNILALISKTSNVNSKDKQVASIKKSKKKPETSLIRIQENILGLSGINKKKKSKNTGRSSALKNLSDLLDLSSNQYKEKSRKKSKKKAKINHRSESNESLATFLRFYDDLVDQ